MSDPEHDVRILIADDHPIFRDALRNLLEQEPGYHVVGEAADGGEVIEKLKELKPDLLLLDLAMPQMSGLEVLSNLSDHPGDLRIIVLTAAIERSEVVEALKLGARGVILKDMATALLFKGIRAVLAGEYWVGRNDVADLVDSLRAGKTAAVAEALAGNNFHLSPRELEVVAAIVEGCTNKDIARKFSLSEQTVKHHLTNIFAKVGVSNRLDWRSTPSTTSSPPDPDSLRLFRKNRRRSFAPARRSAAASHTNYDSWQAVVWRGSPTPAWRSKTANSIRSFSCAWVRAPRIRDCGVLLAAGHVL